MLMNDDDYNYDNYDDEQPFWRVEAKDADWMMRLETQAEETFCHWGDVLQVLPDINNNGKNGMAQQMCYKRSFCL